VALYWKTRGIARRLLCDVENAFKDLDEAVRLDPKNASHYNLRGEAYYWESEYAKAVESYSQAIELDGTKGTYFANGGSSRRLGGAPVGEWLPDCNKAIELEPKNPSHF